VKDRKIDNEYVSKMILYMKFVSSLSVTNTLRKKEMVLRVFVINHLLRVRKIRCLCQNFFAWIFRNRCRWFL